MRKQSRFCPSVSPLESRVVLSHASVTLGGLSNLRLMVRGSETTTLPAGVGGESTASLAGNTRIRQIGPVGFQGTLNDNASLPPPFSNTHGEFVFTARNGSGSVTLYMHASPMDLAPRTPTRTHFTFDVDSATGQFASAVGKTGTADLVLVTRGRPVNGMVHGKFSLVLNANLS